MKAMYQDGEDLVIKVEKIYTTLLRDNTGLGFSIAGGLGAAAYKEGTDSLFVSKITELGAAQKDGKLRVGDKIVQINGVDVTDARHDQVSKYILLKKHNLVESINQIRKENNLLTDIDTIPCQAVQMLTGLERFVRLVVERETLVPRSLAGESFAADKNDKSPKVFGVPKPYTGLYSASSYMANRPSYGLRNREPGNYTLNSSQNMSNEAPATYNANYKLPGLGGIPGENKNTSLSAGTSLTAARSSSTLPTSSSPSSQNLNNQSFDSMIPDGIR